MIEAPPPTPSSANPQAKILVIEDEAMISLLIEDMLLELGYSTIWLATSVAQALASIAERRPDVAVLDVNLGGERAYPVAERLAELDIPFVFATGYGRFGVDARWSARPVIQKPYNIETLDEALRRALGVIP